jgi:hypothetical protein
MFETDFTFHFLCVQFYHNLGVGTACGDAAKVLRSMVDGDMTGYYVITENTPFHNSLVL